MTNIFETKRLAVRNLDDSDFAFFHEMQSDDIVMRYTTGKAFDEHENLRQLQQCIDSYAKPNKNFWVWAITQKSDQQLIGTCAIVPNNEQPEIGYRFRREFFGNGYGQEICNGLIRYGVQKLSLTEIIAYVDVLNVASRIILDRSVLSFVEESPNDNGGTDRFYRLELDA